MIITKTPFRVSFFGGGTDYSPWFEKRGGLVLSATMQKYCYISARHLPPFFSYKSRIVYSQVEVVNHFSEIKHPSVRACLQYLRMHDGLEIHHDGDLPARSGIGSSSAFTVGLLNAIHALRHEMLTKEQLSKQAIEIEQNLLKESVGVQDQIITAYGGFRSIQMGPGNLQNIEPIVLPPDYEREFEKHVLLGFTGVHRTASDYASEQIKKIKEGKLEENLTEIYSIADRALSAFRRNADFKEIGKLIDDSWRVKRTLTPNISTSVIDDIYEIAKRAGAYGGKLLGAGGGGFMLFFASPEVQAKIIAALPKISVWVPFKIDKNGTQIILHNE